MSDEFETLQTEVIRFRDEREWKRFHKLKDLALGLGIEASELAELFLWQTDRDSHENLREPTFRRRLADEMADVQIYLLYLAEASGISLPQAVQEKLAANAAKYPVEKARGNARKYTELD